jgi:hypothetical protein
MHDLAIQAAGILAIVVGIIHGVLGETKVFSKANIEPAWAKRMIRLVWLASAVSWVGGGLILLAMPFVTSNGVRAWIILVLVLVYVAAAVGNAWATRGRHIGWKLLTGVVVLALIGI